MNWVDHKIGDEISKVAIDIKLWESERGIVKVNKETLVAPIELNDEIKGYIFHGRGKLLLDALIETEEGAVGKAVENELVQPFLMLGNKFKTVQRNLEKTNQDDICEIGYKTSQEFIDQANHLLKSFFKRSVSNNNYNNSGTIFAFPNEIDTLDILVAKEEKLVYKSTSVVFVSNKDNVILKKGGEVVCTNRGKSVVITRGRSVILKND